jgi:hypothetical protein
VIDAAQWQDRDGPVGGGLVRSMTATALTSCKVTKARVPSGDTEMNSGSISKPGSCPGSSDTPRERSSSSEPLSDANEMVLVTAAAAAPPLTSMMLTEPTGLLLVLTGSPSLAESSLAPLGVKVSSSGPVPTSSTFCTVPAPS